MAEVPRWSKYHNQSALDGFSILYCDSARSTFLHGLFGRNLLNLVRHTNLCVHNSENRMFFWVVPLSHLLTLVYQLIVKSMRAFVHRCLLLLWSVNPFYSGMTRRNKLQNLIHIQDWVKAVVFRRSNAIQLLVCSTLKYYPSLYQEYHENCTPSYELLIQWYFSPSLFISRLPCCCNWNADKWIVMCEIYTPGNSVAW